MNVRNYNEDVLTTTEARIVRRMIADRFEFEYGGAMITADDMPVFLAYIKLEIIPLSTLDLIIKGCN